MLYEVITPSVGAATRAPRPFHRVITSYSIHYTKLYEYIIRSYTKSAYPFLQQLRDALQRSALELNRRFYCIAESDLNDPRIIRDQSLGGMGLDAQWSDDFHHALHTLLTGESDGYYSDFGGVSWLADAMRQGYAYTGQVSRYRGRRHGAAAWGCGAGKFA